jgi:hypothetical protein
MINNTGDDKIFNIEVFIDDMVYGRQRFCARSLSDYIIKRNYTADGETIPEKTDIDLWNEENIETINAKE